MKLIKSITLFFILFLTFFVTQKVYTSNHTLSESQLNELVSKANDNDIDSQIILSGYYYDLEKYEDSFNWIKKAAELGDPLAQNNLGYMYDNGKGTAKNKKLAYRWFKKAAEQNQVNALTTIASYYKNGEVVNQSYVKAFEFYNRAVDTSYENSEYESWHKINQSRAIYGLGLMHEKGEGTKFNYKKAKELYLKADEYGHEIARLRYDALEGDIKNSLDLAYMYSKGSHIAIGIPIDLPEAVFWFKIAEYKGYGDGPAFNKVLKEISKTDLEKASTRFEVWKKNSGFEYDKETLEEVSPYFINHTGTAFYINKNTLLTNKHVVYQDENYIKKCDKIVGFEPYEGKYETYEHYDTNYLAKSADIEILKTKSETKSYIEISKDDIENGMDVVIIGFPKGASISKYPKTSKGIVYSEFGLNNNIDEFILNATSYGGSSGSPVLNNKGELVGILWGGDVQQLKDKKGEITSEIDDPNISYAVKFNYITKFLKKNNIAYEEKHILKSIFKIYSLKSIFGKFFTEETSNIAKTNIPSLRLIECYQKNEE